MGQQDSLELLEIHLVEGESQRVEFKEKIPDTVRELAEVIASFATSNAGTIYLGIDNSGNVVGIDGLDSVEAKDEFQQRILGITRMVKPQIRVNVDFIQKDSKNIVGITVPKGTKPVYYVGGIPYLRDLSASRRAEPEEVEELYQKYFAEQGFLPAQDEQGRFLTETLVQLSDAQLALSDMEEHPVNPYLAQLRYDLGTTGRSLLQLSTDPVASRLALNEELKEIGKKLQDMEAHQFYLGKETWDAFLNKGKEVSEKVELVLPRIRKNISANEKSKKQFADALKRVVGNLKNEWEIGKEYQYNPELETLRDSFRILGYSFHRLATLPESDMFENIKQRLLELGRRLRALSTPRKWGWGGLGENPVLKIKDDVEDCIKICDQIVSSLK